MIEWCEVTNFAQLDVFFVKQTFCSLSLMFSNHIFITKLATIPYISKYGKLYLNKTKIGEMNNPSIGWPVYINFSIDSNYQKYFDFFLIFILIRLTNTDSQ